jgi:predicted nucleotidyltransferase
MNSSAAARDRHSRPTRAGDSSVIALSPEQQNLVTSLAQRLGAIRGVQAVALGGSHARGRARPGSDIDLYIYYADATPFAIQSIRELAEAVNDTAGPVVTDFYGWGPWVNGGAWLTISGQRVDFVYRSLDHLERVIADAEAGRHVLDYAQQPPSASSARRTSARPLRTPPCSTLASDWRP